MKRFDISDVLSITHGALVSSRHIDGVYDILNYMTGESLFTHQLPRAVAVCAPMLLRQHPQLAAVSGDAVGPENWREWLDACRLRFGDSFDVEPLSEWRKKHPLVEAIEMCGPDRVVPVDLP